MNKKTFVSLAVAAMVFGALTPVKPVLAEESTGSITILASETDADLAGKTFCAYRLFSLTYLNTTNTSVNPPVVDTDTSDDFAYELLPEWNALFTETLHLSFDPDTQTVSGAACAYLAGLSAEELNWFCKTAYDYLLEKGIKPVSTIAASGTSAKLSDLSNGYYLVFETITEKGGTKSKGILSSIVTSVDEKGLVSGTKDVVVTRKASLPGHDKQIYHNDERIWTMVGDNQIGDTVSFRTITSIPDTFGFRRYVYRIHDRMEKGLTLKEESIRYFAESVTITAASPSAIPVKNKEQLHFDPRTGDAVYVLEDTYYLVTGRELTGVTTSLTAEDQCRFHSEVDKETLEQLYTEGYRSIVTYYDAVLNTEAELFTNPNDNTSWLEYSVNPYDEGEGVPDTTTKKRTVHDYTFALDAFKVNETGKGLSDAWFSLSTEEGIVDLLLEESTGRYYVKGSLSADVLTGFSETDTIITGETGEILILGLDDSIPYTLTETKAPAGYKKADPETFTIKADGYDPVTGLVGEDLKAFKLDNPSGHLHFVSAAELGTIITGSIVNEGQKELPVTGGPATFLLYACAGGCLTLSAGFGALSIKSKKREAD